MDCRLLQSNLKNIIKDSLEGLTCVNQDTTLFDFGNVLVQKDYFGNECVRIVSGGATPFGEFVGKGMLTAAIQGESFMAPPSKVILRTIRELSFNHIKGVLIIVPANSGNLLNFGLATERAINDNIRVKLIAVSEDCNKKQPRICRIGLSGVVLVNKIAGAMSEKEKSLNEIFHYCEKVLENISSSGITLTNFKEDTDKKCICSKDVSSGEPNLKKVKLSDIGDDICKVVIEDIINITHETNITDEINITDETNTNTEKLNLQPEDRIVVLLNNNGDLSKTEEYIFVKEFVKILQFLNITVLRFYSGNFLKCARSIDLTITILKIFDDDILEYLDYPCSAPVWKKVNQGTGPLLIENAISGNLRRKDRLAPPIRGPKLSERISNVLLLCVQFACDALISCEKQLNLIDSERGDGDTGTRLKNAAEVLMKRMKSNKVITDYPFTFFESLSKLLEATVGGVMGCIYSTLFEAAASSFGTFSENDEITPFMWLEALEKASEALKRYGNVDLGDGTMYDPILRCATVVREELESGNNFINAFGKGVSAAEEAAQNSKKLKCKYPDSGAHAVGIWMRAVYEGVKLRCPVD